MPTFDIPSLKTKHLPFTCPLNCERSVSGDDGGGMEDIEKDLDSDIMSYGLQGVEAVEHSKMKEQYANVTENKGPALSSPGRSGNVVENTDSYAQEAGILLTTKGVIANTESREKQVSERSACV